MKKIFAIVLVVVLMATLIHGVALAGPDTKGNGLPKGKCYNLNIIGVPNTRDAEWTGGEGKRIFVLRDQKTWFFVGASDHYEVLDRNGTDGFVGERGTAWLPGTKGTKGTPGIVFPYNDGTETWQVEIYARLLGPITSEVKWKTYAFEDGTYAVKVDEFTIPRTTKFVLRTDQLLVDGFKDILWEMYDKKDFRLLQLRIYVN